MQNGLTVVVRGVGDVGSAVGHRLFLEGCAVVLHGDPQPTTTRRGMSFAEAVFEGEATLEGVTAVLGQDQQHIAELGRSGRVVAVCIEPISSLLSAVHPDVLIDARMRKHTQPEDQLGLAPLTIGLGPNFIARRTTDIVVETSWERLGVVVTKGSSLPLAGEPREIAGHARDRYVYAPCDGVFRTKARIGDVVRRGQQIAEIGSIVLTAPLGGMLRGLTHDGVLVTAQAKVIEIDPRHGGLAQVSGIGERPAKIAEGVSAAISAWETRRNSGS